MSSAALLTALAAVAWLGLAMAMARMRDRARLFAIVLLVVAGVPLLGWLTLRWGPLPGVVCFALGLLALCLPSPRRNGVDSPASGRQG